ncbi:MAG: hypothetical protein H6541_12795 [Lentimicrobiaceae bacterium]|nr:hypothetical protein [Lentimicrobiaceae bacterium]
MKRLQRQVIVTLGGAATVSYGYVSLCLCVFVTIIRHFCNYFFYPLALMEAGWIMKVSDLFSILHPTEVLFN